MQYYLFIDECGHHNLDKIEPNFPCFAVCGILVSHNNYSNLDQGLKDIKEKYWGKGQKVIFRSYNIRNKKNEFSIFIGQDALFSELIDDINKLIESSKFKIICPVIHKAEHRAKYGVNAYGAYEISINFILQRCIYSLDKVPTSTQKKLKIILEQRGHPNDAEIGKHIDKLMTSGDGMYLNGADFCKFGKDVNFIGKYKDLSGLQFADLMAYPILTKIQNPDRVNPAYDILTHKLDHKDGVVDGYGVVRFPKKQ